MSERGESGWGGTPDDVQPGLTEAEKRLCDLIGDCIREFRKLPEYHPADRDEMAFHVHAMGRIVMSRAAIRAHPYRLQPGGPPERRSG